MIADAGRGQNCAGTTSKFGLFCGVFSPLSLEAAEKALDLQGEANPVARGHLIHCRGIKAHMMKRILAGLAIATALAGSALAGSMQWTREGAAPLENQCLPLELCFGWGSFLHRMRELRFLPYAWKLTFWLPSYFG